MSEITFNPVPVKLFKNKMVSSDQSSMKPRSESKLFGIPENQNNSDAQKSNLHYVPGNAFVSREALFTPLSTSSSQEVLFTPLSTSLSSSASISAPSSLTSSLSMSLSMSLSSSSSILHPKYYAQEKLESQSQYVSSITIHNIKSDLYKNSSLRKEDFPLTLSIYELMVEIGRRFCMPLTINEITGESNVNCFEKLQIQFEKIYPEWIQKMNLINSFVENTEANYSKSNYLDLKKKLSVQIMNISISLIMLGPDAIHNGGFEDSVGRNSEKFVTSLLMVDNAHINELSYLFTLLQLCELFQPVNDSPDITRAVELVIGRLLDVIPEDDTILINLVQEKIDVEKNSTSGFNANSSELNLSPFKTALCNIIYEKMAKNSPHNIRKILYKTNMSILKDSKQIFNLNVSQLREIKKNLLSIVPIKDKINNFITNFTYGLDDIYYYKIIIKKKEFTHTTLLNENERLVNNKILIKKKINELEKLMKTSKNIAENSHTLAEKKSELELNAKNIENITTKIKNIISIIDECKNKINLILSMIFDTIDFTYFIHDDYLTELDWGLCDNNFFNS